MNRQQHLAFCKLCEHGDFNFQRGILCKLTGEYADFENDCPDFRGNRDEIVRLRASEPLPAAGIRFRRFLSFNLRFRDYYLSLLLALSSVVLFVLLVFRGSGILVPDVDKLVEWGANFTPLTIRGQYWRLLSANFLHLNLEHLFFNVLALLYIGIQLESRIGKLRLLAGYIFTGIAAFSTSLWWHGYYISLGASGAILGLFGIYIALLVGGNHFTGPPRRKLLSMLILVLYSLICGIQEGIDNAAHIGGLLGGLLMGFAFRSPGKPMYSAGSGMLILLLAALSVISKPRSLIAYHGFITEFAEKEEIALQEFSRVQTLKGQDALETLDKVVMPAWNRCMVLLDEIRSLEDLPDELYEREKLLALYCEYRLSVSELTRRGIEENTGLYGSRIGDYTMAIDNIALKLQGAEIDDSLILVRPDPGKGLHLQYGK